MLLFYLLIATLEDSGYLTSLAVLTDRLLGGLGLSGRTAIPLLAATACNVPAIYATRVLATRRERILASFLVTLVPCSARSAVVVAALVPFAGAAVAAAAFGLIVVLTLVAGIAANAMMPGSQSPLVMELAPLRRPLAGQVWAKATARFRGFLRMAAPVMIVGSIALGLAYESGLVWPVASVLDPVVEGWLGLPSVAGLALVFAFLRKELALQLLLVLAAADHGGRRVEPRRPHDAGAALRLRDRHLGLDPLRGHAGRARRRAWLEDCDRDVGRDAGARGRDRRGPRPAPRGGLIGGTRPR